MARKGAVKSVRANNSSDDQQSPAPQPRPPRKQATPKKDVTIRKSKFVFKIYNINKFYILVFRSSYARNRKIARKSRIVASSCCSLSPRQRSNANRICYSCRFKNSTFSTWSYPCMFFDVFCFTFINMYFLACSRSFSC